MTEIRVFLRRTCYTPDDDLAFIGVPPVDTSALPRHARVSVSVAFPWDMDRARSLAAAWASLYRDVQVGGPGTLCPADEFVPGRFLRHGITISSRGCSRACPWCFHHKTDGNTREIPITQGRILEDANLLLCSERHVRSVIAMLSEQDSPEVGALDTRVVEPWHIEALHAAGVRRIRFAADYPGSHIHLRRVVPMVADFPGDREVFVLAGYHDRSERGLAEVMERIHLVEDLGFSPICLLYQGLHFHKYGPVWADLQEKYRPVEVPEKCHGCRGCLMGERLVAANGAALET